MPDDLALRELYGSKTQIAGTFGATGTIGSISVACKDVFLSVGSNCYVNFGTTAGANVANSFYIGANQILPLYNRMGGYITCAPVSGTAYVSVIGYY